MPRRRSSLKMNRSSEPRTAKFSTRGIQSFPPLEANITAAIPPMTHPKTHRAKGLSYIAKLKTLARPVSSLECVSLVLG